MESDPITTKEERWHRVRNLGHGAYGTVWQEQCVDEPQDSPRKVRAVKSTPKHHFVSWRRELNALMKFSQVSPDIEDSWGRADHEAASRPLRSDLWTPCRR